jgi:hypothetical protein
MTTREAMRERARTHWLILVSSLDLAAAPVFMPE